MTLFPDAAWPGLAYFNPDKLLALETRFAEAQCGSDEQRSVRAEARLFVQEFRLFAARSLSPAEASELARLCELQKASNHLEAQFTRPLLELIELDLTPTELGRLVRLAQKHAPPTHKLSEALEALDKWRGGPG